LQAQQAAKIFALLFGLNLFTTGIQSVFAGLQRTFEVHLVNVVGSLLALLCLWLASEVQAGLVILLLATLGVQTLATLGLLALLVRRQLFTVNKLPLAIQSESRGLLRSGSLFFVLQIGTMVGWGSDALIISSTLGPASVAVYSVVTRLFQFVSQPLAMINAPLWGAYADAHSKNDMGFIKKTLTASLLLTFVMATAAGLLLYALGPWLISLWTRDLVVAPTYLLAAVAVWTVMDCCGGALGMFLNGMNIVKQQVMVVSIFCLLVLPLKVIGASEIGLIAIPVAAILTYALTHGLMYGVVFLPQLRSTLKVGRSS
jgi:O-antigen/teichoic acid export membrane protein